MPRKDAELKRLEEERRARERADEKERQRAAGLSCGCSVNGMPATSLTLRDYRGKIGAEIGAASLGATFYFPTLSIPSLVKHMLILWIGADIRRAGAHASKEPSPCLANPI